MADILFSIARKELKIAQIAQCNQLFQLLILVCIYIWPGFLDELSSILMRKDVNNNIKKDSPIISHPTLAPVIVNNNAQTKHERSQISK